MISPNVFQSFLQSIGVHPDAIAQMAQGNNNIPQGNPLDLSTMTGVGNSIVATPEQEAQSAALAQQLGNPQVQTPTTDPNDIVVSRGQSPTPEADPIDSSNYLLGTAPSLGNASWSREAAAAVGNQPQHKGMFGLKGTLRDVLGTLGDAFLVQGGGKAIYAPQRQNERVGDALAGMTAGDAGMRGAIERVAQLDPEMAQHMNDKFQGDAIKSQQQAAARYAQGAALFGQYANASNAETYERAKPVLRSIAQRFGLGEEFAVPEEYDAGTMGQYGRGGMKTNQQYNTDQGQQRIDQTGQRNATTARQGDERIAISRGQLGVAQQNAETARRRMEKSGSAGSRPRADSELEVFRAVGNVPEANRTQWQKDFYTRYTQGTGGRGGGSGRTAPPPPSSPNRRFRIIR